MLHIQFRNYNYAGTGVQACASIHEILYKSTYNLYQPIQIQTKMSAELHYIWKRSIASHIKTYIIIYTKFWQTILYRVVPSSGV